MKQEKAVPKPVRKFSWMIIFICFAVASVIFIVSSSQQFSLASFFQFVKNSSWGWIICAFVALFGYIFVEGCSLRCICKSFGFKTKKSDGFIYAASDIYFSAITPSATGGQPASAYFMHQSGISVPVITVSLIFNVLMYTISLLFLGILVFLIKPGLFFQFTFLSKVLIISGFVFQTFLVVFFYCLLYKDKFLYRICAVFLKGLAKIHLVHDVTKKLEKLNNMVTIYQESAKMIKGKRNVLLKIFGFNLLQRICQIGIVVFVFLATNGEIKDVLFVLCAYTFVLLGAYTIPIPGAIGVTDFLLLDVFKQIMVQESAIHLELFSRFISFYFCVILCGIAILIKFLMLKRSSSK